MPQIFVVLQCFSCKTFQVQQKKRSNKWSCKVCGEKQSLKKVFGEGSGAECRVQVQTLNAFRGEVDKAEETSLSPARDDIPLRHAAINHPVNVSGSKWKRYCPLQDTSNEANVSDRTNKAPKLNRQPGGSGNTPEKPRITEFTQVWGTFYEEPKESSTQSSSHVEENEFGTNSDKHYIYSVSVCVGGTTDADDVCNDEGNIENITGHSSDSGVCHSTGSSQDLGAHGSLGLSRASKWDKFLTTMYPKSVNGDCTVDC